MFKQRPDICLVKSDRVIRELGRFEFPRIRPVDDRAFGFAEQQGEMIGLENGGQFIPISIVYELGSCHVYHLLGRCIDL